VIADDVVHFHFDVIESDSEAADQDAFHG